MIIIAAAAGGGALVVLLAFVAVLMLRRNKRTTPLPTTPTITQHTAPLPSKDKPGASGHNVSDGLNDDHVVPMEDRTAESSTSAAWAPRPIVQGTALGAPQVVMGQQADAVKELVPEASSSTAAAAMPRLGEACEKFKQDLGVEGTSFFEVIDASCEALGICNTQGLNLMQKAQKCWEVTHGTTGSDAKLCDLE